jgi:hypothetical protein
MATIKVRRKGETLEVEIGAKSKAKDWEQRAAEMHGVVKQLQEKENLHIYSQVKYDSCFMHFLEEYKHQLIISMMSDLDIPVWMYSRIQNHIDNCKPNQK